jgi:hypothetical protein
LDPNQVAGDCLGTFRPIFWNRITFPKNKVHTLGILCEPNHPVFRNFPTDFHSNWQWQDLLDGAKPLILDGLPQAVSPLIQPIDDWNNVQKLGVLVEVGVESGRLMLCTLDVENNLDQRPAARQLRWSLLRYLGSDAFDPAVIITESEYRSLFVNHSRP